MPMPKKWPTLERRGGTWSYNAARDQCELQHYIGKHRYRERGDTPAECMDARDERRVRMRALADGEVIAEPDAGLTVAEVATHWYPFAARKRAPSTVRSYERLVRQIKADAIGSRRIASLNVGDVEDFLYGISARRVWAQRTIAKVRTELHMLFAYAQRRGYVVVNPVPQMVTPVSLVTPDPLLDDEDGEVSAKWLDEEEFARMRAYLKGHPSTFNTVFLLQLLTGLRPGEALGLRWDAVDFDQAKVKVRTAMQTSGSRQEVVPTLKNPQSRRTVQLTLDVVRALQRERRVQREKRMKAKEWPEPDVAFTTRNGRLIRSDALLKACERACAAAGVKRITPNGFRHSNASMLLAISRSHEEVARHLGHKNAKQVIETYGHPMKKVFPVADLLAEG